MSRFGEVLALPQTVITSAQSMPAGAFTAPGVAPAAPPGLSSTTCPEVASYTGAGSLDDAASFVCKAP